ncbi:MAG: xylulose 5-phosphate 3-epimerase [Marinobacter sp.]|uniref:xylulose 5-phosphate 3-epimerase n=1 Tax=Marinobacter sp. TaxID=50741 RepID=UPI0029C1F04D|nr:xylulose 5-phosphate 3-epimerase [Marinobacter sp.]MDX5335855.1 xylulose 5-phosphate 3-epimerase [Marinobacter sp.]MDX5386881.1 xylulose 5-phosphate 3-epimerase [Marinobacter sp.]MDX5441342.1 xylulose 5-phosphate 3-epimerase [Alteromonadaceae bacterium]MDX5472265.1 xylulose 5-phosphate 3-epimerase [Marinobacter sp.]
MPSPNVQAPSPAAADNSAAYQRWQQGYGVIRHSEDTEARVQALARKLVADGLQPNTDTVYQKLAYLDRLTSAGLWLVVHMTYCNRVDISGAPLAAQDFKASPEGHTGGALNMVPAYAAYLALNNLTGQTRSWLMGQGHCVAAVDALNVLTGNLHPEQRARYLAPEGLSRLAADFYSYRQKPDGAMASPLGSHVNPHTAGGILEGGYLGFAELQYAHMPLPGESLVAFLSDGAAEEQRGSDWIPRWWRADDCGQVLPIMIANGRRIEQRTELGTREGLERFAELLEAHGFEPVPFDGKDPAAFVCTLFDMEQTLAAHGDAASRGEASYPVRIPYGIAETTKGFGFYGAGQNSAHNLPLPGNPRLDTRARDLFNEHIQPLWVSPEELEWAVAALNEHRQQQRPLERDHPLALRNPREPQVPVLPYSQDKSSPMTAVDAFFRALTKSNPDLRPRVGNPDELASNRLTGVLKDLKHRVNDPESDDESIHGHIITALNEEAVVSACLGNKAGLNLVASYEAFCVKMLGAVRQELIFARHQKEVGRPARWLGFPIIATSHTWENGKNEQSHQDTTFCEAMLGEMSDVSRVLFPADYNSALAVLPSVFTERGRISCMVIPKRDRPCVFNANEAERLARHGALVVDEDTSAGEEPLLLIANGAYQLSEAIRACERLRETGTPFRLVYLQEPGRFRQPRDPLEAAACLTEFERERLFPHRMQRRVALTHMRPEVFRGHLHTLFPQPAHSQVLGYINRGGTLNEAGMLFANQCSWGHTLAACADVMDKPPGEWLSSAELAAVEGRGDPSVITRGLP